MDGDTDRYDRELRPDLTVQIIEYLQDRGVEPAIWKIEGLATREAAERIAAAARRDGREARCIVLGRHAPKEQLDEWLRIAAPVEGSSGSRSAAASGGTCSRTGSAAPSTRRRRGSGSRPHT